MNSRASRAVLAGLRAYFVQTNVQRPGMRILQRKTRRQSRAVSRAVRAVRAVRAAEIKSGN